MEKEEIFIINGYPYPLTIVSDRYNGVYSGGRFLAFNLEAEQIPYEVSSDDVSCGNFWGNRFIRKEDTDNKAEDFIIGKGNSPNEAVDNLIWQCNQYNSALTKEEAQE